MNRQQRFLNFQSFEALEENVKEEAKEEVNYIQMLSNITTDLMGMIERDIDLNPDTYIKGLVEHNVRYIMRNL